MNLRPLAAAAALLAAASASAGDLRGLVKAEGALPKPAPLPVTKDHAACGEVVEDETLLLQDGALANAIVTVTRAEGPLPPPPPVKATLDQRRCRFIPHALVVPVGTTLELVNGDAVLHNVHGWAGMRSRFNEPMPEQGQRAPAKLDKPGLIQVRCDVHAWMSAYVMVVQGPAAVTGRDGRFALTGLPAGSYTVHVWHERLGETTSEVKVPAEGMAEAAVTLSAR